MTKKENIINFLNKCINEGTFNIAISYGNINNPSSHINSYLDNKDNILELKIDIELFYNDSLIASGCHKIKNGTTIESISLYNRYDSINDIDDKLKNSKILDIIQLEDDKSGKDKLIDLFKQAIEKRLSIIIHIVFSDKSSEFVIIDRKDLEKRMPYYINNFNDNLYSSDCSIESIHLIDTKLELFISAIDVHSRLTINTVMNDN